MNYRTIKHTKANLFHFHFSKNANHKIVSKTLLNLSTYFIGIGKSLLNSLFTPTKYMYDEASDTCRPINDNYYFKNIEDLKLISSRRTFL